GKVVILPGSTIEPTGQHFLFSLSQEVITHGLDRHLIAGFRRDFTGQQVVLDALPFGHSRVRLASEVVDPSTDLLVVPPVRADGEPILVNKLLWSHRVSIRVSVSYAHGLNVAESH